MGTVDAVVHDSADIPEKRQLFFEICRENVGVKTLKLLYTL